MLFFKKTDDKEASVTKLEQAIAQLSLTIEQGGMPYPDYRQHAKAVKCITRTKVEYFKKKHFRQILAYLQQTPANLSAEFLEDDYGLDFEAMDADVKVDYCGGYTFVPDKWLPKALVRERENVDRLSHFYIFQLTNNPAVRKKIKNVQWPMLRFAKDTGIEDVEFENTVLFGLTYIDSGFYDVNFYECNLQMATFRDCDLSGVRLTDCRLDGAQFIDCAFEYASLSGCKLKNVAYTRCTFENVQLFQLNVDGVDLSTCTFKRCLFSHVDLSQHDNLKQEVLDYSLGDDGVLLPPHLKRPSFWPKQADPLTWGEWLETGEIIEGTGCVTYE